MEAPRLPSGVGLTALGAARGRAAETARPDRLIDDPFAARFVTAAGAAFAAAQESEAPASVDVRPLIDAYLGIRSRFFDDAALEGAHAGVRQVVVLGAGLDARAFRLDWPRGTRLFEVDTGEIFSFKEPVLRATGATPRCERIVVAEDLRHDWPATIRAAGFDADRSTTWLLDGLLMYLAEADRDALVARLSELAASGSRLALEPAGWTIPTSLAPAVAMGHADQSFIEQVVAAQQTALADASVREPIAWLARHGWHARLYLAAEQFVAYGRSVPELLQQLRRFLVTATRNEKDWEKGTAVSAE